MSSNSCANEPKTKVDAKRAAQLLEMPPAARQFASTHKPTGKQYRVYRGEFVAAFSVTKANIQRGLSRSMYVTAHIDGELEDSLHQSNNSKLPLCLLSSDVVESNAKNMSVPVVWQLNLAPRGPDAKAPDDAPFRPSEHVAVKFVTEPRQQWKAATAADRRSLLTSPLVYQDAKYPDVKFCATDAWGFSAEELMQNVAILLPGDTYFIPTTYRYSSLLCRVRSALILANARQHTNKLFADTMPETAHLMTGIRSGFEINGTDLSDAIDFIEKRLVASLVVFDGTKLELVVSPFGSKNWLDVWTHHNTLQAAATAVSLPPSDSNAELLEISLRIVAFFVALELDELKNGAEQWLPPTTLAMKSPPANENDDTE